MFEPCPVKIERVLRRVIGREGPGEDLWEGPRECTWEGTGTGY